MALLAISTAARFDLNQAIFEGDAKTVIDSIVPQLYSFMGMQGHNCRYTTLAPPFL